MQKYIYPNIAGNPKLDFGWFRLGGPGLANCMFVAARAYSLSKRLGVPMFNPSWAKFSIGPYLRREPDKRHYFGLFNPLIGGTNFVKIRLIRGKMMSEEHADRFLESTSRVLHVTGLGNYFQDLNASDVKEYFDQVISPKAIASLQTEDFSHAVSVHVRMGDYTANQRVPIDWYAQVIGAIAKQHTDFEFLLFSDGSDEELRPLLGMPRLRRVFFGNALADMVAISRTRLVIASDSTFSGWGAYLGQRPVIFPRRHFAKLYDEGLAKEWIITDVCNMNSLYSF